MNHLTKLADQPPKKVKCKDCGFLSCFDPNRRRLDTLTDAERKSGRFPQYGGSNSMPPMCFVAAAELFAEYRMAGGDNPTLTVITEDRLCSEFFELHPGLSPKAHRKMKLSEEDRDWRRKVELEDRDYRDKQRKDDQDREEARQGRESRRFWIQLLLVGIIIPVVVAMLTIGSAWLQPKSSPPVGPPTVQPAPPSVHP